MRELAILEFQTLDGVMQAPSSPEEDVSGGFAHGGWAAHCWDEVMEQVGREAMAEPYDLLLGRTTYDMFAASFAGDEATDPLSSKLNDATKHVVTARADALNWRNSVRIAGDIAAAVSALKAQDGPLLQVHGSWQLVQALLGNALVDEFRLWTFPVVVGSGKRLFADGSIPTTHRLAKLEPCRCGAFMSVYRRAGQAPVH